MEVDDVESEDYFWLCEKWLSSALFLMEHEGLDADEIIIHDEEQKVLSILCFLFPLINALTIKNVGDSGTKTCGCCDGYMSTYYDFSFEGELLCNAEETMTEYDTVLLFKADELKISDMNLARLVKIYKKEMHSHLIAVAWHPDRAFKWVFPIDSVYCKND